MDAPVSPTVEQLAEQPAEPAPRRFVAIMQIGNNYPPGATFLESDLHATNPGCDVDRLLTIGAMREV